MNKIRVEYNATIASAMGVTKEAFDSDQASSFGTLLMAIGHRHGDRLQNVLLDADGQVLPSIVVAVNDHQVVPEAGLALAGGDSVLFLSAVGGG